VVSSGFSIGNKKDGKVDILDLENPNSTCWRLKNVPLNPPGSVGFLDFHGRPVICGGIDTNILKNCYSFDKAKIWNPYSNFTYPRAYAAVTSSNWLSKTQKFLVTGSNNSAYGNTAEILTETGWVLVSTKMPYFVHHHCSVMLNSTTAFIIGGYANETISNQVLLFNMDLKTWTNGPSLNFERHSHSCGKIIIGNEYVIIVVGGVSQGTWSGLLPSVEIFNSSSNSWIPGPTLPYAIAAAGLAEDPMGGIVLVGGGSVDVPYMNTSMRLRNANPGLNL
jgi:hypothetical protein